jgi:hypothetical protein
VIVTDARDGSRARLACYGEYMSTRELAGDFSADAKIFEF